MLMRILRESKFPGEVGRDKVARCTIVRFAPSRIDTGDEEIRRGKRKEVRGKRKGKRERRRLPF